MPPLLARFIGKAAKVAQLAKRPLRNLLPSPRFESLTSLHDLHRNLYRVGFSNPPDTVRGWLSSGEERALYALGRYCGGPILEVGAWLGRSTICIARGIADSGKHKEFLTCELNPTIENYRAIDEDNFGFYYPPESEVPMGVASLELFERDIKPVVLHPLGVVGQLRANLKAHKVDEHVSVFIGDFRRIEKRPYNLLFADTMHDEQEIRRNAKDLSNYLTPGSILACHDTTPSNEQVLRQYFNFSYFFQVDSLFIGEIASFGHV